MTCSRLLWVLLAGLLLSRLLFLEADPAGPYLNTDEGHQNNDARSIVLYGTPFHDTYNPSVLMPVFTWFKVPWLKLIGVNLTGLRVPSVLCCAAAVFLMAQVLARRGEPLAAVLLLACVGLSFYDFSHARLGNHEPVLQLVATLAFLSVYQALETGLRWYWTAALVLMVLAPLVKTSGVFVMGGVAACLAYLVAVRRGAVDWRGIGVAALVALAVATGFGCLWFWPHAAAAREFFAREVSSKGTSSLFWSGVSLAVVSVCVCPFALLAGSVAVIRLLVQAWRARGTSDSLGLVLSAWVLSGLVPLLYSNYHPPRFLMWITLPLLVLALREYLYWLSRPALSRRQLVWLRPAGIACLVLGTAWGNWRDFCSYYRAMAYYIRDTAPKVEAIVGSAPVSGSGFDDFASASAKLNLVSCFHYSALATPDDIRRAFPRPEMEPKFLSMHVGGDETAIPGLVAEFYTHCPEWKSRYKPFRRFRRINPPGTWDQWFVRTTP